MDIRRELLVKLKQQLFRGNPQIIRARLIIKGFPFTSNYISRCLNPDHKNFNPTILDEAIKLGEENTIRMNTYIQRLDFLNNEIE